MANGEETNAVRRIMLALGKRTGIRIFRNNVGTGWIGNAKQFRRAQTINVGPGDVLIKNGRIFIGGLCKGSSDTIGFRSVEVTREMVGTRVAVFMACEVKTKTGRPSKEQTAFLNMVTGFGGIAMMVTNEDEALKELRKYE